MWRVGAEGKAGKGKGGEEKKGGTNPLLEILDPPQCTVHVYMSKTKNLGNGNFLDFFGRRAAGDFCEFKTGIPGGPGRRGLCDADVTLQIVRAMFPETLQSTVVSTTVDKNTTTVYCRKTNGNPISGPHLSKSCEILHLGTREAPIFTL